MKRIYPVAAVCCFLPAIILCWYMLTAGNATWFRVKTSTFAMTGENFNIQVTLTAPAAGYYLGADIHGMNNYRESTGYIAGGRQIQVNSNKKIYEFSIPVPNKKDVSFIFPVIILSGDGTWAGRISAAETGPLPVRSSGSMNEPPKLEFISARDTAAQGAALKPESRAVSIIISLILVTAAAAAVLSRKQFNFQWIAAAAAASAAWEMLNSSTAVGNIFRTAALGSGMYSGRRLPQQFFTIAIILLLAGAVYLLIVSGFELYIVLSWLCIILYCGINLLQVLSLHEADRLLSVTVAGVQTGQMLRLSAAVVFLFTIIIKK